MQHVGTNDLLYLPIFCCIIVPFHQLLPQKFRWKGREGSLMIWSIFIKTRSLCCWATDTWSPDWLPWSRAGIFLWYWKCIYQIMQMKPKRETHSAGHLIGLERNNVCCSFCKSFSVQVMEKQLCIDFDGQIFRSWDLSYKFSTSLGRFLFVFWQKWITIIQYLYPQC